MQSLSHELLQALLHNFVDLADVRSTAAVCTCWRNCLREQAFWQRACLRRWPSTTVMPVQDFSRFFKARSFTERNGGHPRPTGFCGASSDFLPDMYLMIEATMAGQAVSLALCFKDAAQSTEPAPLARRACRIKDARPHGVGLFQNRRLILKNCHLWRASDERMVLIAKDRAVHKSPGAVQPATFDIGPVPLWNDHGDCMSICLRYQDQQTGDLAQESLQDALFDVSFSIFSMYADTRSVYLWTSLTT